MRGRRILVGLTIMLLVLSAADSGATRTTGSIVKTIEGVTEVYHVDCGNVEARLKIFRGNPCFVSQQTFMEYSLATNGDDDTDPATGGSPTWRKVFKRERGFACNPTCYHTYFCDPGEEPTFDVTQSSTSVSVIETYSTFQMDANVFAGVGLVNEWELTNDCRLGVRNKFTFTGTVPEYAYGVDLQSDKAYIDTNPTYWADDSSDGIYMISGGTFSTQLRGSAQVLYLLDGAGQAGGMCNSESQSGMCLHITTAVSYSPGPAGAAQVAIDSR
ncbi:MAG: hypothetical protein QGG50_05295, partial [Methanopyri archaeon]|nr:hypothetical protein [Methanopyri archaeon]